MPRNTAHLTINATASTTEVSVNFGVEHIVFIANDDATNNLLINFDDNDTTAGNVIVLKPNEVLNNLNREVRKVHYKSSASTVAFRVLGIKTR